MRGIVTSSAWTSSTQYTCCGIKSTTDRHGVATYHTYDGLGRRTKSTIGLNRIETTTRPDNTKTKNFYSGGRLDSTEFHSALQVNSLLYSIS